MNRSPVPAVCFYNSFPMLLEALAKLRLMCLLLVKFDILQNTRSNNRRKKLILLVTPILAKCCKLFICALVFAIFGVSAARANVRCHYCCCQL